MDYIKHTDNLSNTLNIAILIKQRNLTKALIQGHYLNYLNQQEITNDVVISFELMYNEFNKAPAKYAKEYLNKLLPVLTELGVKYLLCCDTTYFKYLTGVRKTEPHRGYILPCTIKGHEELKVIICPNYSSLFYNPLLVDKIYLALDTLVQAVQGVNQELGYNIIHSECYPDTLSDIAHTIKSLHKYQRLTCDIETFDLHPMRAGIGTIAFAGDKHNGIAFAVDYGNSWQVALDIRKLLKQFFDTYSGELIFHGITFDVKILIYELYMEHMQDMVGMVQGLETFYANGTCTRDILYLATNTTAGNNLTLKNAAHEFAGNWAQNDINDITKIPLPDLLRYNLVDCLATWYTYEKYYQIMCNENQLKTYHEIIRPSNKVITQVELNGMPLDADLVLKSEKGMLKISHNHYDKIQNNPLILQYNKDLQIQAQKDANTKLKVKVKPLSDFDDIVFNPNSGKQLIGLLYEKYQLPIIDRTKKKAPSTGAKTLNKLLYKTKNKDLKILLKDIIEFAKVDKIITTFIKAMKYSAIPSIDGRSYLHGNFKFGTVSGRLSSSGPNLQNIPSKGTIYAKYIKECFRAPDGWILAGADFSSLEDKISALTTRDTNKLKVYEKGFDGHSMRAYSYFKNQMPDIIDTVESINSIEHKYPSLRQDSKMPTFLLTYMGTWHGIIEQGDFTKKEAQSIEKNYHELYAESDEWVHNKLIEASNNGYVTGAFGLRLRTPILKQVVLGTSSTPYEAQSEARTAGNMLGQSYGLLNNRSAIEFQERTFNSKYVHDIRPIAHIHDNQLFLIRDNVNCVKWFNDNLIECMQWQELPELKHDIVKLGGNVELYYPDWDNKISLPNQATKQDIINLCKKDK